MRSVAPGKWFCVSGRQVSTALAFNTKPGGAGTSTCVFPTCGSNYRITLSARQTRVSSQHLAFLQKSTRVSCGTNSARHRSQEMTDIRQGEKGASLVAQTVENLSEMQETWVQSLGWEDPLEKGMATHSRILDSRIQSMESQRVGHD